MVRKACVHSWRLRASLPGSVHCPNVQVTIIDFPQMVSVHHANAKELFERDVECIVRFFHKKLGYSAERDTSLPYVRPNFETSGTRGRGQGQGVEQPNFSCVAI